MDQMRASGPPSGALEIDVERLDASVEEAIRVGAPHGLRVLGYGELTLVIGWPTEEPVVAVKRLPPFPDADRLDAYARLLERYVEILRERGVTVQAVAGALAIYLAIGIVFAGIINFIAQVDSTPYFAQHTSGTPGDPVYFSFTALTTTGFGDFSAATPVGHALAVIEMLTGQIYLVTVIELLISNFASRQKTP